MYVNEFTSVINIPTIYVQETIERERKTFAGKVLRASHKINESF